MVDQDRQQYSQRINPTLNRGIDKSGRNYDMAEIGRIREANSEVDEEIARRRSELGKDKRKRNHYSGSREDWKNG